MEIDYIKKPKKVRMDMNEMINQAKGIKKPEPVYTTIDIERSFVLNIDSFFREFANIATMSDNELDMLIRNNFISILELVPRINNNPVYAEKLFAIFSDVRCINSMINISDASYLDYTHKVYLNHIIYDYIAFKGGKCSNVKILYRLADTINSDVLPKLYGSDFDRDLASYLAICRYSSFDDFINVKRVNLALFLSDNKFNLQNIVDVYQILFNTCVGRLFEGVMFDVYSKDELDNATENQRDTYSMMGIAILELLNVMPSNAIKVILSGYAFDGYAMPKRFSLKLSDDYYRINEVIDILASEGINIY